MARIVILGVGVAGGETMAIIDERIQAAPLPCERERHRRSHPIIQFVRFVALSWRTFRLARKHD